jgi:hypothetical protein
MLLSLLFSTFLATSPLPPDSVALDFHRSGFGPILGVQLNIVDHNPFRLAPGPVLGCYWQQTLGKRSALQVELQGRVVSGYRLGVVYADTLVQPSGIGTSQGEINVRSAFFMEMPVLFRHHSGPKSRHAWLAGIRPSLNRLHGYQTNSRWSLESNGAPAPEWPQGLKVRQGFYQYELGLVLGWSYALSRRLSLDVRYNQGLVDLTADNFFKSDELTLNSGLQCTLRAKF